MPELSQLSIVVVSHNTKDILRECLSRLEQFAQQAHIIIVDTESTDGTCEMLTKDFPHLDLIHTTNYSMAHAVNVGLKAVRTTFIAHMNADVYIQADTFSKLLDALEPKNIGIVGARNLTPDGKPQNMGVLYKRHYARLARVQRPINVGWLAGCLQVTKRKVIDNVGGLNSSYRFYNEDIEWCWRIRKAGYDCLLVNTDVTHLGGSSTPSQTRFLVEGIRGGMRLSQQHKKHWFREMHYAAVMLESSLKQLSLTNKPARRTKRSRRCLKRRHFMTVLLARV